MWTSQVYGHYAKMVRTKTHRTSQNTVYTKMQQTLRNNYFVCALRIFMLNYRLGTVNKNIGGLNQFPAAANLALSQHFLEKKKNAHLLFLTRPLRNETKRQESE